MSNQNPSICSLCFGAFNMRPRSMREVESKYRIEELIFVGCIHYPSQEMETPAILMAQDPVTLNFKTIVRVEAHNQCFYR